MQLANIRRSAIGVAALTLSIGSGLIAPSARAQTPPPDTSGTGAGTAPVAQESAFIRGMRIFANPALGANSKQSDAIPLLTQAITEEPKNGDALTTLGYLEAQEGHYDLAIGYLQRAILIPDRLEPESALTNLAVALLTKPDSTPNDRVLAIDYLEKAAAVVDPEPRTVESAAAEEKKSSAAHNTQMALGGAAARAGLQEKAAAAFRRATVLESDDRSAWSSLGVSLYNLQQEPEALTALKRATSFLKNTTDPKDAQLFAMLGNLEVKQGDKAAGQKDLEKARTISQEDVFVQSSLGTYYAGQGNHAEAAAAFGVAADKLETDIKASPEGATSSQHEQIGSLRYRQGLEFAHDNHNKQVGSQAVAAYKKSIAADPNNVGAMINCGALLYGAGQYDDAITYYNMALAKNPSPENARLAWKNLAVAYSKKHDTAKANLAWREVLRLDPGNTDALQSKVAAIVEANAIDDAAIPVYKQLAQAKPTDAEPLINLGLLYERQVPYVSTAAAKQARLLAAMQCFTEAIKRGTAAAANASYEPMSRAAYNATTATAYNNRGVIHEQLAEGVIHEQGGEIAKARADYKKALELKPDFEDARKNLARFTTPPTAVVKANGKRP